MPNIFHQSVEDILKVATPEQKIIWNDIFLRLGERASIAQFFYSGNANGELFTYIAGKAYFGLQITPSFNVDGAFATAAAINIYDINNVIAVKAKNLYPGWDSTAAAFKYAANVFQLKNIVFGRLEANGMSSLQFVGYRITY